MHKRFGRPAMRRDAGFLVSATLGRIFDPDAADRPWGTGFPNAALMQSKRLGRRAWS